jgi:inhibitor of cysteine peptidase
MIFMLRKIILMFACVSMLLPTTGCASEKAVLTLSDKGGTINIKAGGQIEVQLEGNPSTGYTWEAKDLDTTMIQKVGVTEFSSDNPGLVGTAGTLKLTFKILKTGRTSLTLVYQRPWEKDVEPLSTYQVTIIGK